MASKKGIGAKIILLSTLTVFVGLAIQPAYSCSRHEPSRSKMIIKNTTISGLIREDESQYIQYTGKGMWSLGHEACFYIVWRLHCNGTDLQAHIELGKVGEGIYMMEIYHSWSTPEVVIGGSYSYVVKNQTPHMLILIITET